MTFAGSVPAVPDADEPEAEDPDADDPEADDPEAEDPDADDSVLLVIDVSVELPPHPMIKAATAVRRAPAQAPVELRSLRL